MTLPDALQAYARSLAMRHVGRFLRFAVKNAANDNGVR
jgi:hypothetical protein